MRAAISFSVLFEPQSLPFHSRIFLIGIIDQYYQCLSANMSTGCLYCFLLIFSLRYVDSFLLLCLSIGGNDGITTNDLSNSKEDQDNFSILKWNKEYWTSLLRTANASAQIYSRAIARKFFMTNF